MHANQLATAKHALCSCCVCSALFPTLTRCQCLIKAAQTGTIANLRRDIPHPVVTRIWTCLIAEKRMVSVFPALCQTQESQEESQTVYVALRNALWVTAAPLAAIS